MPVIIFAPSYLKIIPLVYHLLPHSLEKNCCSNFLFSLTPSMFSSLWNLLSTCTCYYSSILKIKLSLDPILFISYCSFSLLLFKTKFLETITFYSDFSFSDLFSL